MSKYTLHKLSHHFIARETCTQELAELHIILEAQGEERRDESILARALVMQRGLRDFGFITNGKPDLRREEWERITEAPQEITTLQAALFLTRHLYLQTGSCSFKSFMDFRECIMKDMKPDKASEYLYTNYKKQLSTPWRSDLPLTPYSSSSSHSPSIRTNSNLIDEILAVHLCINAAVDQKGLRGEGGSVDIVIPVYGKIDFTLRCIHSVLLDLADAIASDCLKARPTLIVVDDASPNQEGVEELAILNTRGVCSLIQNRANMGYLKSCNIGANSGHGRYLIFLNNDTSVCQGWIQSLLTTFEQKPTAGLVGSKLIYPNGLLQEAGGIVWRDGSAWNYGREQNPLNPEYSYMRSVDYISGASIAITRSLFTQLEGFDTRYAPAYYEDTDLCLRVREAGREVLYQPCSRVIHHEGISCGTDTSNGIKKYQLLNHRKFFLRWQEKLLKEHENRGDCVSKAKNKGPIGRCLVIESATLTPDQDAGSRFVLEYCLILISLGYEVSYLPAGNFHYWPDKTPLLQGYGIRALYSPFINSIDEVFGAEQPEYDFCIICRPEQAPILEVVRNRMGRKPLFYFTHDIHHRRMELENETNPGSHSDHAIDEIRMQELNAINSSTCTIHISDEEQEFTNSIVKHESVVIRPTLEICRDCVGDFNSKTIVFIGSGRHAPNPDGILWFANDVLPIIRSQVECRVVIAGSGYPIAYRQKIKTKDIEFLGFVEDLEMLYCQAAISIAPLRFGAGVKGKVLESFAHGLPCVMTTVAAEGLEIDEGIFLDQFISKGNLLANDFANRCIRLLSDEATWREASDECFKHYNRFFSRSACTWSWINLLKKFKLPYLRQCQNNDMGYSNKRKIHRVRQDVVINGWELYQYSTTINSSSEKN